MVCKLIVAESEALVSHFRPRHGSSVTEILANFSVKGFLSNAKAIAPSTFDALQAIDIPGPLAKDPKYKDRDVQQQSACLQSAAASTRRRSKRQRACTFLHAEHLDFFSTSSTTRVLSSYLQAIHKLKTLGQDCLAETGAIVRKRPFKGIWTMSTSRSTSISNAPIPKPISITEAQQPSSSTTSNLLPSRETTMRIEDRRLWHIQDILYDAFPALRKRFKADIPPVPTVEQISLHQTKQYPLPATHIDKSSLEGTLHVLNTIFQQSLQLTEDDIKRHGIILCAGDQLLIYLLHKVSTIRRDDTNVLENTEGQDGRLHLKISHTRMVQMNTGASQTRNRRGRYGKSTHF
ncbi:hypothetical protein BDN70DRAFT_937306 [Pholiota conissans]|uniref:DUF6589 domain-containing protein n=1 Tax=Pholiota conissans TaxID=109636 RepID=A0A9P5YR70_9AGAR|nr:hypothetical protein BDN70DRAFT_937306 [Pholiota conissans]